MKWNKIVEIQYDAIQRSSALFVAILAAIAVFSGKFATDLSIKIALISAFLFVLIQSLIVLFLTDIQREASWENEQTNQNLERLEILNKREVRVRKFVLYSSLFASLSIFISIALIIFHAVSCDVK